ncbi:hypothetical protein ACGFZU_36475 [Streptomyces tendae]|uniref:hypothetical protein n=1 Tax=Streptomyces tendae TaxID=1932 RepID=UPI003723699D
MPAIDDSAVSRYQAICPAEAACGVDPYDLSRLTLRSYAPSGERQVLCSSLAGFSSHPPGLPKQTVREASLTRCQVLGRDDEQDEAGAEAEAEPDAASEAAPEAEAEAEAETDGEGEGEDEGEDDGGDDDGDAAAPPSESEDEDAPASATLRPSGEEPPTRGIPKTARSNPATAVIAETTAATSPIRLPGETPPPELLNCPTTPLCHRTGLTTVGHIRPLVLARARRLP